MLELSHKPSPGQWKRQPWVLGFGIVLLFMLGIRMPALVYLFPDVDVLAQQSFLTMNLFANGFLSWITAWSIFQLYHVLKHRMIGKRDNAVPLTDPFDLRLLVLALLFSAMSWYGMVAGVIASFLDQPLDRGRLLMSLLIGTAGTCLYFFVGMLLERIRRGFGFWLLMLLQALYFAGTTSLQSLARAFEAEFSRKQLTLMVALLLASALAAVFVMRPERRDGLTSRHIFAICLVAMCIATFVAPAIYAAIVVVWPMHTAVDPASLSGIAVSLLALIIEIFALLVAVWLFLGSLKNGLAAWDIVLGVAGMFIANEILVRAGAGFWPSFWPLHYMLLGWAAGEVVRALPYREAKPVEDVALDEDFRRGWR
jgi:hypothetical protein